MSDAKTIPVDRREFFRRGLGKAVKAVVKAAEARVERRAEHWIRPPYALDELDFLIACTRCGACIDSCPHDVLFPLEARLGLRVVSTPAMDLMNGGCRLCDDWPCVAACAPGALLRPAPLGREDDDEEAPEIPVIPPPRLAEAHIDQRLCLPYAGPECGACAHSCPVPGALVWHGSKPHIDLSSCLGCAMCREACIVDPKAISIRSIPSDKTSNQPA